MHTQHVVTTPQLNTQQPSHAQQALDDPAATADVAFKPVPVQHAVDDLLQTEPDTQQHSWLWNMMAHIKSLPSSREAPDYLARYQNLVIDDKSALDQNAEFQDGASNSNAKEQDLDVKVLKHLQELQEMGSAPVRDVKTDMSDPDQQWWLLDGADDRSGPNAIFTEGLPDGGVREVATRTSELWSRTSSDGGDLEVFDPAKLPPSSHHVCCMGFVGVGVYTMLVCWCTVMMLMLILWHHGWYPHEHSVWDQRLITECVAFTTLCCGTQACGTSWMVCGG